MGSEGALSTRFWERSGVRVYSPHWCESVRVVGDQMLVTFDEQQRPAPTATRAQLRTVSAWGDEMQRTLARLRVGIVGVGSVGALVAESLARIGVQEIRLIDFDTLEEHNRDRMLHVTRADIGLAKVQVLAQALRRSATAEEPLIEPLELSVCEEVGFQAALDCDILFSCVERPWPRKVLNIAAYAHLIPVVDGGIRVNSPRGLRKRADWRALIATPERACLECSTQFDPADVALERGGELDDPHYIEQLPEDHRLRRRENVFAFSAALASLEVMQMLAMVVAPLGVFDPGIQTYHFVTGSLDQEPSSCQSGCRYSQVHLGRGDEVIAGAVAVHDVAERLRGARRDLARDKPKRGGYSWRRLLPRSRC